VGEQLPLDIVLRDEATLERFVQGNNAELVELLAGMSQANGQMILISGIAGSGKTHLLQATCRLAKDAMYLPLEQLPGLSPAVFDGLSSRLLVCLDDIHLLAANPELELALFGLINEIRDSGHSFVFSSRSPLDQSGFELQDLVSRLSACMQYALELPDEANKISYLREDAARRGLELGDDVISWMLTHMPRDMPSLASFMMQLDRESLRSQRKITIPFAKQVLSQRAQ
jgi:DnaA family protein